MRAFVARNPVFTFIAITWILQWGLVGVVKVITPPGVHVSEDATAHGLFRLRLLGPLLVCLVLTWYLEGGKGVVKLFAAYTRWKVPARWYLLAFTWKFINAYLAIGAVFLIYGVFPGFYVDRFWEGWAVNLPAIIYIALMEETSWMKFGVTRLQMRYNALTSALIIGFSWGMWYLPMLIIDEGVPPGYPVPVFMGCMLGLGIMLTWAYNMTRSGLVLLVMQIISNTAFFVTPVLPAVTGDQHFIVAYSWVFMSFCALLPLLYGARDLARRPRARWDTDTVFPAPTEEADRELTSPLAVDTPLRR
ncbi:MAG: hypothetical protein IT228_13590 [Flavobacteriales bacterium]|nr:hypothetical protein [Flavobacteriales bacterium]MCC6578367.1 hypothetical protein [Flavobacteriales bacterium]NUQ14591.1 hypothetical protein [Flavobacteriales bacterium]